jgi:hypothetical protein
MPRKFTAAKKEWSRSFHREELGRLAEPDQIFAIEGGGVCIVGAEAWGGELAA